MRFFQSLVLTCLSSATFLTQAASFQIDKVGNEPLYQSILPVEVYQASRSHHLQDLTFTNAAGEQVPYTLFEDEELHPQSEISRNSQMLVAHPVTESQLDNAAALHIQLNQTGQHSTVDIQTNAASNTKKFAYLIDAGVKHPAFKALKIDWEGNEGKLLSFEVLASDNLKDWHSLGSGVLIKVASDSLIQNTIEISGDDTSRYLQIRPTDADATIIKQVRAEYLTVRSADRAMHVQKVDFIGREQDQNNHVINLDFEAQGRYPVQYLRVELPQLNTVTSARFYVRNKLSEPWQYLTTSSLYRIEKDGKLRANPDVQLNTTIARYWRMQFDEANGGLGADNPSLSLAWRPHTAVWNARGNSPFKLNIGDNPKVVNFVDIQGLIPDYKIEKVLQLPKANVGIAMDENASTSANTSRHKQDAWSTAPDYKSWLLWAGLALGVLLLAGMAYSLLKTDNQEK
ncbi:MAG TPA: DUF3999 domain-containing protein [Methylotenera sp.]|nr:DUF3999 domain-containing protein [Methylotenera sp.]HPH04622.1 DUF3999 domain-containing protein [Methylotenera sp.]HPN01605.1 DUF3999 domain-containing protein [Methylotenera sp.]